MELVYHTGMKKKVCLYPSCTKSTNARGLCRTHYGAARRLVAESRITWDGLVTAGKCLDKMPHRELAGSATNWFMEAEQAVSAK